MAHSWTAITLTTMCSQPQSGTLLLPTGSRAPSRVVMLREPGSSTVRLLKAGVRPDPGAAAWADASVVAPLGGEGARAEFTAASSWDVLRHSLSAKLQLAIAILTLASTALAAIVAFYNNASSTTNKFAARAAFAILLVATGLAVVKFIKDWRDAFVGS